MNYSGKLKYSTKKMNWLTLEVDPEIGRYYRFIHNNEYYGCKIINRPSWDEHITIIRNEDIIKNQNLWGSNNGNIVQFELDLIVKNNGNFVWMDVECQYFYDLRLLFGLKKEPEFPFHLTIGNLI